MAAISGTAFSAAAIALHAHAEWGAFTVEWRVVIHFSILHQVYIYISGDRKSTSVARFAKEKYSSDTPHVEKILAISGENSSALVVPCPWTPECRLGNSLLSDEGNMPEDFA